MTLVETSAPGNLGAAMRVTANFGIARLHLVRPAVDPAGEVALRWACGAQEHLEISVHDSMEEATGPYTTVVGTASARGRSNLPVIPPGQLVRELNDRVAQATVLVFGNETRGLRREDLDHCDLVVRIPTAPSFPVLNLAQSIAILTGYLAMELEAPVAPPRDLASHRAMEELMRHMEEALLQIGFLDPVNPKRVLRKIRRLLGRSGVTQEEVTILHGICRQTLWASAHRQRNEHDPS